MLWQNNDTISLRFWWSKHSSRRRYRQDPWVYRSLQFHSVGNRYVYWSLCSCCFPSFLSLQDHDKDNRSMQHRHCHLFIHLCLSLQLSGLPMDAYRTIDIHLHTTFPLSTTSLTYLGIFYYLKKQSRVSQKKQNTIPCTSTLRDVRREKRVQMERKLATTSFRILLFVVVSLIPYFVAIIIEMNCQSCGTRNWFLAFREACLISLFLNCIVNPFLATFRINELNASVETVLGLRRADNARSLGDLQRAPGSLGKKAPYISSM